MTNWVKIPGKKVTIGHLSNCKKVSLAGMESVRRRVAKETVGEAGTKLCRTLRGLVRNRVLVTVQLRVIQGF